MTSAGIVGVVASLVTKSMLSAEARGDPRRKLEEAGESDMMAQRLAQHVQEVCVMQADK
ncbi:hypothetical protein [Caballeronia sp. LZ034LL]|uniref:hypothetical protein n=1 Tax=Caballeronia sp. LZ034LL TaxID=3038567 RepID=UPI00285842BA|nr:hypothetical protein [Caballeronia sp. LZ034LL]MDR5835833.1 hypothetical protein [Caballeronia sp. LZ034LL]